MCEEFFQRTQLLVGKQGIQKLKEASVAVIGLGGVGSYALEAIARCGVGRITIVDPDQIEPSNINRQLLALASTVGEYKAEVAARRLAEINPHLQIKCYTQPYCAKNSQETLSDKFDYLIDAIDSFMDKIHLITTCVNRAIPIISVMGAANRVNPMMFTIADIKDTTTCPMARKVRRALRKENIQTGVNVVYSREQPVKCEFDQGTRLGSISFVPAAAGLLAASFVIKNILED